MNRLIIVTCALIVLLISACSTSSGSIAQPLTSTPTVYSDDGFTSFAQTFAQDLHPSQFQSSDTVSSAMDQDNFKTYFDCYYSKFNTIDACKVGPFEDILSSGQLYLSVNVPLVPTCSNPSIQAYEVRSVMGEATYNPSQPGINPYEGYARFTFIKPIPGSNWTWEELDKVTGQCQ